MHPEPTTQPPGVIVAVRGSVVDMRFDFGLPAIHTLLRAGAGGRVAIEVLAQRDERHVRGIALTPTRGLAPGQRQNRRTRNDLPLPRRTATPTHAQEKPMKIQLNTDTHIDGTEALAAHVRATIEQALERFSEHVTRVEVHLGDENGGKAGQRDQRCMMEARLEGRQPVAVTEHAATLHQAVHGAAQKMAHRLDSTLGRLHNQRGQSAGPPVSGTEPTQL